MLVWPILWRDVPSLSPATWFIAHWWQQLELLPWFRAAWTWEESWLRSGRSVRELGGGQAPSSHSCVWIFNLRSCMCGILFVTFVGSTKWPTTRTPICGNDGTRQWNSRLVLQSLMSESTNFHQAPMCCLPVIYFYLPVSVQKEHLKRFANYWLPWSYE